MYVGNYEQGDENRQLGAKLDDLKIDIDGDDDDDSGHNGVRYWWCLTFYIPLSHFSNSTFSYIEQDLLANEMKLDNQNDRCVMYQSYQSTIFLKFHLIS